MNSHTRIEILLGRPHLDRNPKPLQHLPNSKAQNMQADNLLIRADAHELHLRRVLYLLLRRQYVVEHRRESRVVYFDLAVAESLARLRLREPDCADLRVREDDRRNVFVRQLGRFELGGPEEAAAELASGGDGNCAC